MNKVIKGTKVSSKKYTVGNLCKSCKETAFIGKCGGGPEDSLYLITYEGIVLAFDPKMTWNDSANITVNRFVDIEIKAIER